MVDVNRLIHNYYINKMEQVQYSQAFFFLLSETGARIEKHYSALSRLPDSITLSKHYS